VAYTTVMTMMKILERKKYVKKTMAERAHVYRASQPQAQGPGAMVKELINRVFNGSAFLPPKIACANAATGAANIPFRTSSKQEQ
jgi:predicted transcriptional regulator